VSRNLRYSEDELREQWSFIDSLVESQASALRSGVQDPEEEPVEVMAPDPELLRELDMLRERVRSLETERAALLARLRTAEDAAARGVSPPPTPPRPWASPPAAPAPPRGLESRVRAWWRRVSR
jgi:hypothetical protein